MGVIYKLLIIYNMHLQPIHEQFLSILVVYDFQLVVGIFGIKKSELFRFNIYLMI